MATNSKAPYHHGDLHDALIEAAVVLVREVGADQFSLRDAARTVGVSANATYRHFENKAALLTAVAAAGLGKMAARMQRKLAAFDVVAGAGDVALAVERFNVVGRAYVDFSIDNAELFRVMFGPSGVCKMLVVADPDGPQMPRDLLDGVLDDLVTVGVLTPARRAVALMNVWTALHGFASLAIGVGDAFAAGAQRKTALEAVLAFILDGLAAPPSPTTSSSSSLLSPSCSTTG